MAEKVELSNCNFVEGKVLQIPDWGDSVAPVVIEHGNKIDYIPRNFLFPI